MVVSTGNNEPKRFGQEHFLIDRVVATLLRAGADWPFWEAMADDPVLVDSVYELYLTRQKCTTPARADGIMGKNMHGLGPARRHFGRKIGGQPYKLVPFSAETLEACRNSHVLVAVTALSVNDVEAMATKWGYKPGTGIYPGHGWLFLPHEKNAWVRPMPGWYLIRKQAVGLGETFEEATALLGPNEFVPSLAVLAQAMLLHFHETGERLYHDTHVWASDIAPPRYTDGEIPSSIYFGENGLMVDVWGGQKHPTHGLSAALNPEAK